LQKSILPAEKVLVIGGGDTGSDCVGTANRQGALSVHQFEIMAKPTEWNKNWNPNWPEWPSILRTSTSHKEGCYRDWAVTTNKFNGRKGEVTKGLFQRVEWISAKNNGQKKLKKLESTEFELDVDLVLLAMGFEHVEHNNIIGDTNLNLNNKSNIAVNNNYMTSVDGIFAAGDASMGASLIVHSINHGRNAANCIHKYLTDKV